MPDCELHCPFCHDALTDTENLIVSHDMGEPHRLQHIKHSYACSCGAQVVVEAQRAVAAA